MKSTSESMFTLTPGSDYDSGGEYENNGQIVFGEETDSEEDYGYFDDRDKIIKVSYQDLCELGNVGLRLQLIEHAKEYTGQVERSFSDSRGTVTYRLEKPLYRIRSALNKFKWFYIWDFTKQDLREDSVVREREGFVLSNNGEFKYKKIRIHNINSYDELQVNSVGLIIKLLHNNRCKNKIDYKLGYETDGIVNIFSNSVLNAGYLQKGGCYKVMPRGKKVNDHGSFGTVKESVYNFTNEEQVISKDSKRTVVKIIEFTGNVNEEAAQDEWNIMNFYLGSRHPQDRLFKFFTRTSKKGGMKKAYLCQEHGGSDFKNKNLSLLEQVEALLALTQDLNFLHGSGIKHIDVKPANALKNGKIVKLADFGSAGGLRYNGLGTYLYSSPEQFLAFYDIKIPIKENGEAKFLDVQPGAKTDVFSLGMFWLHLLLQKCGKNMYSMPEIKKYEQLMNSVEAACNLALTPSFSEPSRYQRSVKDALRSIRNSRKLLAKLIRTSVGKAIKVDGTVEVGSLSARIVKNTVLAATQPYSYDRPTMPEIIKQLKRLQKAMQIAKNNSNDHEGRIEFNS